MLYFSIIVHFFFRLLAYKKAEYEQRKRDREMERQSELLQIVINNLL